MTDLLTQARSKGTDAATDDRLAELARAALSDGDFLTAEESERFIAGLVAGKQQ